MDPRSMKPAQYQDLAASKKPARTSSELLQKFFRILDLSGISYRNLAKNIGTHNTTITEWKHGRGSPRLSDFEHAVRALGYRLVLVRVDD